MVLNELERRDGIIKYQVGQKMRVLVDGIQQDSSEPVTEGPNVVVIARYVHYSHREEWFAKRRIQEDPEVRKLGPEIRRHFLLVSAPILGPNNRRNPRYDEVTILRYPEDLIEEIGGKYYRKSPAAILEEPEQLGLL